MTALRIALLAAPLVVVWLLVMLVVAVGMSGRTW